jgi:hypothetical protein
MKTAILKVWDFLVSWGETMQACRKSQGRDFNRYI